MPVAGCGERTMFMLTLVLVVSASCVNPTSCWKGRAFMQHSPFSFPLPFPLTGGVDEADSQGKRG